MKTILKGILLWSTILLIFCTLAGIDSITDKGFLIEAIVLCVIMVLACKHMLTKEEIEKLSLVKWFENL